MTGRTAALTTLALVLSGTIVLLGLLSLAVLVFLQVGQGFNALNYHAGFRFPDAYSTEQIKAAVDAVERPASLADGAVWEWLIAPGQTDVFVRVFGVEAEQRAAAAQAIEAEIDAIVRQLPADVRLEHAGEMTEPFPAAPQGTEFVTWP